MGRTSAVFHTEGKVPVPMQRFISRLSGKEIAGAAIFSILAPNSSDPVALWDGMCFSSSSIFCSVICEIVNCAMLTLFVRSLMYLQRNCEVVFYSRFRSNSKGCFTNQKCLHILCHNQRKYSYHSILLHRFLYQMSWMHPELHWKVNKDLHKVALQPLLMMIFFNFIPLISYYHSPAFSTFF